MGVADTGSGDGILGEGFLVNKGDALLGRPLTAAALVSEVLTDPRLGNPVRLGAGDVLPFAGTLFCEEAEPCPASSGTVKLVFDETGELVGDNLGNLRAALEGDETDVVVLAPVDPPPVEVDGLMLSPAGFVAGTGVDDAATWFGLVPIASYR